MKGQSAAFGPLGLMNNIEGTGEELGAIYVDMGTTNTRAWLMRGSEVVARANKPAGVADTARDGSPGRIYDALREVITLVRTRANDNLDDCVPSCVAAAGMITSSLGLAKLPQFCVRLLELANECTPEDRLSFLIGAFVAADLDRLVARELLVAGRQVVIAGDAPLAGGWSGALTRISIPAVALTAAEVEKASLAGFRHILRQSLQLREIQAEE